MTALVAPALAETPALVHYLPIASTAICIAFLAVLSARAIPRKWPPHLLWWAIGVSAYGLGTALESAVTLFGNTPELTRWWYWAGAILGGYPLATGTVYLLMPRRKAHVLTAISLVVVVAASAAVLLTPLDASKLEPHRPSGAVLEWQWVRLMTPFINGYAALFLIGGAFYSSYKFLRKGDQPKRAAGTALIAVGGILPGIGGSMAKGGIVEALYIGELIGIVLIWFGYEMCVRAPKFATDRAVERRGVAGPGKPASA
ncbi:MAG: hypothetical protein AAFR38_01080 [Planctomycetota bacterium]